LQISFVLQRNPFSGIAHICALLREGGETSVSRARSKLPRNCEPQQEAKKREKSVARSAERIFPRSSVPDRSKARSRNWTCSGRIPCFAKRVLYNLRRDSLLCARLFVYPFTRGDDRSVSRSDLRTLRRLRSADIPTSRPPVYVRATKGGSREGRSRNDLDRRREG